MLEVNVSLFRGTCQLSLSSLLAIQQSCQGQGLVLVQGERWISFITRVRVGDPWRK